jgi:hypothetical protein
MGWTTGVHLPTGAAMTGIILSPPHSDRFWCPLSLLSNGYRGIKRPGRGVDHSPPSSAEVKNAWSPSIRVHGLVLN